MEDDRTLVEAILHGQAQAFGQLVNKYHYLLLTAACQLIGKTEDAEDLVQETLLAAYQRLGQLHAREKFRPWLFTILRHKCIDYLRCHQVEMLNIDDCEEIPAAPGNPSAGELFGFLSHLSYQDREVLAARYLYEMEYEEIAYALNITVRATRMRCLRARERMRLLLQADEEETRYTLRRAMHAITVGFIGDGFLHRVMREVTAMKKISPPPILTAHAVGPVTAGWKIVFGMAAAFSIAGTVFVPPMPNPHAAFATTPARTEKHAAVAPPVVAKQSSIVAAPTHALEAKAVSPAVGAPARINRQSTPKTPSQASPSMTLQIGNNNLLNGLVVSPNNKYLATISLDNTTVIWDLASGMVLDRIQGVDGNRLQFSKDSRFLCIPGEQKPPVVWDIAAGQAIPMPKGITGGGWFTIDGSKYWELLPIEKHAENYLLNRWEYKLWDLAGGKVEREISTITGDPRGISRDNTRAVTITGTLLMKEGFNAGIEQVEFLVWDLTTGKELTRMKGLSGTICMRTNETFSPDGKRFAASSSTDNGPTDMLIWDTNTGKILQSLNTPHTDIADCLVFSEDGLKIATGGRDQQAIVWDATTGHIIRDHRIDDMWIHDLAFSPDGAQLVTGSLSRYMPGHLQRWDIATGKVVKTYATQLEPMDVQSLAMTADGKQLAIGGTEQIALWDIKHGQVSKILQLPKNAWPASLAFSIDGTQLLAALYNAQGEGSNTLRVWDTATGELKKTLTAHGGFISRVAFSPDGMHAVSCSRDKSVIVWNTRDWIVEKRFLDNPMPVENVVFSPDGMKVAWTCTLTKLVDRSELPCNSLLTLWDIPSGRHVAQEVGEGYVVADLTFGADGRTLLVVCDNNFASQVDKHQQIRHYDTGDGREVKRQVLAEPITRLQGPILLSGAADILGGCSNGVYRYTLTTGKRVPTGITGEPVCQFTTDQKNTRLITSSYSSSVQCWDLKRAITHQITTPCATLMLFKQGGWLITTPKGYFDCSREVATAIVWRQSGQYYPYAQFAEQFHRPNLVRKALAE